MSMLIPSSTYRVQLHRDFTFRDLEGIVDYLHSLGITTIYAAPILVATPGSMHGYDVIDFHQINPEIGTLKDLKSLTKKLKEKSMSWIQDIVPNHMAFSILNFRLMDVLERGEASPYYNYFDIDWKHHSPTLHGKVMVPFLGNELANCINGEEIKISFSEKGFTVDYLETSYPLSLSAYESLFSDSDVTAFSWQNFVKIGKSVNDYQDWKNDKEYYVSSIVNDEDQYFSVLQFLERFNKDKEKLMALLDRQFYRLSYWKDTEFEINYRRFFTVNELICLRMEDEAVFNEYHSFLYTLYKDKIIQGLRIDHIDGLKDPLQYSQRLRGLFGENCYVIAEKILETKEDMPGHWPLEGTSGYEFLAYVNQVITNRKGAKELASFYRELVPQLPPYKKLIFDNKKMILEKYMAGEWNNLLHYFLRLGLGDRFKVNGIKQALGLLMISLPVYRIYPDRLPLTGSDVAILNESFQKANVAGADYRAELEYLQLLFTRPQEDRLNPVILCFLQRLMQFTGPLTAKGVEDTTFYVYNALLSHDEVGDSPSVLGISISEFHKIMAERQRTTPLSLNATATHDTKRGEDSRLRLNALCEFPGEWIRLVREWLSVNKKFHTRTSSGKIVPSVNDEYFIYQSVVGGIPETLEVSEEFVQRIQAYMLKVVREAKRNSDWADPNEEYEESCKTFISNILKPGSEFLSSVTPFVEKIIALANRYALGQVLIKITSPGIPDIYQGCELWDLSFVDPDNRRPVDYKKRIDLLTKLDSIEQEGQAVLFSFLEDNRKEGVEKLFATSKAINFRRSNPELFTGGSYTPVQVTGKETLAVAYVRNFQDRWALVVIPLGIKGKGNDPSEVNDADEIILPENSPGVWLNVMTGDQIQTNGRIRLSDCFNRFPVALFTSD